MIGINDVWRQFDCPLRTEQHVAPERYRDTYRALLAQTRGRIAGLILLGPFVVDTHRADPMRRQMENYAAIARGLAAEFDARFVDTQAAFDRLMETFAPTELAWDRIHPGPTGHMAIARALLDALDFPWPAGR
jgi:lysophospholipase L1-like esterase